MSYGYIEVFEKDKLLLKAHPERGAWKEGKVQFTVLENSVEIETATVDASGFEPAVHEFEVPEVSDDRGHNTYQYLIDADGQCQNGSSVYRAWPRTLTIEFLDAADESKKLEDVRFQLTGGINRSEKELVQTVSPAGGVYRHTLTEPTQVYLDILSPFKAVEFKEGAADSGRKRVVTVEHAFTATILTPKPGDEPHEQVVNLDSSKKGADGKGSLLELTIGGRASPEEKDGENCAIPGTEIFVKCEFKGAKDGEEPSKRNKPARTLKGVTEHKSEDDGKVQTGKVKIGDDKTAKVEIELGSAGLDQCVLSVGLTDEVSDHSLTTVNWRKIYFQNTAPDTITPADPSKAQGAFEAVGIKFEEYESDKGKLEANTKGMPSSAWVDGKVIDSKAAKKVCVVGTHNVAWFKTRFEAKADKSPAAHIIYCDYQLDAQTNVFDSTLNFDGGDKIKWPPDSADEVRGWAMPGSQVHDDCLFFSTALHDGKSDAVKDGKLTWKCKEDASKKGDIARDHIAIDQPKYGNYVYVKLPQEASDLVDAGKTIDVHFKIYWSKGWYAGWCTNGDRHTVAVGGNPDQKVCAVLCHEIGHAIQQVPESGSDASFPGLDAPPHGRQYSGRGHSGSHCAKGLDDATYKDASKKLDTAHAAGKCTCIMFGANTDKSANTMAFCDLCSPYVTAVDISDVTT